MTYLINSHTAIKLAELKHSDDLARAQRWREARGVSRRSADDGTSVMVLRTRFVSALFHAAHLRES